MTNLPANAERTPPAARARGRSLREQASDLHARYAALPQRQRIAVIAAACLLGWFVADELVWKYAREWSAESTQIEQALDRGGRRAGTVTTDLRRSVATFGPLEPPGPAATGREELARAIDEALRAHKVNGYGYEARTGQRVKDADAATLGGAIDRLQAEVKFEVGADELPSLVAELESSPVIDGITSLRLERVDAGRKVKVQATIESWVISAGGRSAR